MILTYSLKDLKRRKSFLAVPMFSAKHQRRSLDMGPQKARFNRGIQLTAMVESGYLLTEEPIKGGMDGGILSLCLVLDEARSILDHLAELIAALYGH